MKITQLDHLVLTVKDVEATVHFYSQYLGMEPITFAEGRKALAFGNQKINLHQQGAEFLPHAEHPTPGSADLCFICESPISELADELMGQGIEICAGPVQRTGATGPINSIYLRDPDNNLIELANYLR